MIKMVFYEWLYMLIFVFMQICHQVYIRHNVWLRGGLEPLVRGLAPLTNKKAALNKLFHL